MKKIIFLLSFVVFGIISQANAQLNVTSKIEKEPEAVCTLRMQYSWLKWSPDLGYFIAAKTDNQFDDPLLFVLGKTGESAIATLKDIIALIENQVALTTVQQSGKEYTLILEKMIGKYYISIKEEGNAGDTNFTPKELEKGIKKIKERENL